MVYRFGRFVLNSDGRVLYRDGEPVLMTGKCLDTLIVLIRNHGQVMSKDDLISALWPDTAVEDANLTQNVSTVRKALGDNPKEHRYILTVSGRGYSFVEPVTEVPGLKTVLTRTNTGAPRGVAGTAIGYIGAFAAMLVSAGLASVLWRSHKSDPD